MQRAIDEAKDSVNVPIGAVLVADDKIIASAHNGEHPTAHAEMLLLAQFDRQMLKKCDLYVTVEPCIMCASAIAWSQIRRVYFGAYDEKGGAIENGPKVFNYTLFKPEYYGGLCESECSSLVVDYFQKKRIYIEE